MVGDPYAGGHSGHHWYISVIFKYISVICVLFYFVLGDSDGGHDFQSEVAFMNFQSMLAQNIYSISSAPSRIV